jgi:hypothetical protein
VLIHDSMLNCGDYTVLLNGEDVTRYAVLADDQYNFVFLLVPYSRLKAEAPSRVTALIFPDVGISIDSAVYEKREGHVEILHNEGTSEGRRLWRKPDGD